MILSLPIGSSRAEPEMYADRDLSFIGAHAMEKGRKAIAGFVSCFQRGAPDFGQAGNRIPTDAIV